MAAYGQPRFEVAYAKPGPPDGIGSMNGGPLPTGPFNQTNHDPGRITRTNVRLGRVIQVELVATKVPVETLVIDHLEKVPTEN